MGLEQIAVIGGTAVGGGIVLGNAVMYLLYSIGGDPKRHKEEREQQKKIAQEWNLPEQYNLGVEELALPKVGVLAKLVKTPYAFNDYSDEIVDVFKEYRLDIIKQSGDFEKDPAETEAFKQFLADERTRQWLLDPQYVMSDRGHEKLTSSLGLLLDPYKDVGIKIRDKVLRREHLPRGDYKYRLAS